MQESVLLEINDKSLAQVMMEAERQYLEYALTKSCGNKTQAAHMAGVSLTTFRDKLSRFTVKVEVSLE